MFWFYECEERYDAAFKVGGRRRGLQPPQPLQAVGVQGFKTDLLAMALAQSRPQMIRNYKRAGLS